MAHHWRFFRAGGFDQVRLDTGEDFKHLGELDPKLWVALSCPTRGLEFDPHTLDLLDQDKDGRIRVPEVIAASVWAAKMLKNADDLANGHASLPLNAINVAIDEGRLLFDSAKQLLMNLGKADATHITPADISDTVKIFGKTLFNGDGVIPPEAAEGDIATAQALRDIMTAVGSVKDLSGLDGVSRARLDGFYKDAGLFLDWANSATANSDAAGFDAYKAVKAKVDDFFARGALAAMDPNAAKSLNASDGEYLALAAKDLSPASKEVAGLPIARIDATRILPLNEGLNPAWAGRIAKFRDACVKPMLGAKASLIFAEWETIGQKLAAQEAWNSTRPEGSVHALGVLRLKELTTPAMRAGIEALIKKDMVLEPQLLAITSVDKLTHYYRDLATFLNNFVAFRDFYTHKAKATFQAGTLYLDARSCDLCLQVEDTGKHAVHAAASMAYLAYCDLTRKGSPEKMTIVAAFTNGDSDYLLVGRNGVFYDRRGRDWDATITKIIDNPISVLQAFWSPYKRIAKFVEDQINGFAAAKDKESHDVATGTAATALKKEATPFDVAKFAGVFAAVGLAVGLIGSAIAAVLTGFLGLKFWQMPLAIAGAMLLVSGPSMLLAAMKLRKRVVGPMLEGSGWAVNGRAALNIPFGKSLTQLAMLPPGSRRELVDKYAAPKRPWGLLVGVLVGLAVLALAVATGLFDVFFRALNR